MNWFTEIKEMAIESELKVKKEYSHTYGRGFIIIFDKGENQFTISTMEKSTSGEYFTLYFNGVEFYYWQEFDSFGHENPDPDLDYIRDSFYSMMKGNQQ